jgi:hypothetical protein
MGRMGPMRQMGEWVSNDNRRSHTAICLVCYIRPIVAKRGRPESTIFGWGYRWGFSFNRFNLRWLIRH